MPEFNTLVGNPLFLRQKRRGKRYDRHQAGRHEAKPGRRFYEDPRPTGIQKIH